LQTRASCPSSKLMRKPRTLSLLWLVVLIFLLGFPPIAGCETYGIKDDKGTFVPKVTVNIENKEILIKKTDPIQEFATIALTVNQKNRALVRNVKLLNVQWINRQNQAGKPLPFAGPRYNADTRVYKDSMAKSLALKIFDKSTRDLFDTKELGDLFAVHIDDQPLLSSESYQERDRTVRLGTGRDLSLEVSKTAVDFTTDNLKTGEIVDVYNRSGHNQTVGVTFPKEGWTLFQIVRKIEQQRVPKESWGRFSLEADAGFSLFLIADPDPAKLAGLSSAEITIKVWEGNKVRETRRIPIRVAPELLDAGMEGLRRPEPVAEGEGKPARATALPSPVREEEGEVAPAPSRRSSPATPKSSVGVPTSGGIWLWGLQVLNLVLLAVLAAYGVFFLLPKIQVLEDRLAKNEMFLHGSREAIREELEEIKEDILRQCRKEPPPE